MMPTKTSVGPNEVVRLEVLRLAPPLPIPAEQPSWDRDRLRSQNNVGGLAAAKEKAGYKASGSLLKLFFSLGFRAPRPLIPHPGHALVLVAISNQQPAAGALELAKLERRGAQSR
jgi:hypothetical protein